MKIYVMQNSYYIGDNPPQYVLDNATVQEITIPEGKQIRVENGQVTFIEEGDLSEI
jgi:hypothetical protein